MNLSRSVRLAGLILAVWLLAIIISLTLVPRLPENLPTWLPWVVAILLSVISVVADLMGLFVRPTPVIVPIQPPPPPLNPLELPPDLATWTGREADTHWLLDQVRHPSGVVAITGVVGMGGIGKSALAVHVAHQLTPSDFPDGILWLDLRGGQPDVLLSSIAAYYGQRERVDTEPTLQRKAAVVRSILSHKRALLILDNAESSEQLDPLLPGEGPCVTLVTTRHRNLRALRGAATRALDQMSLDEARALIVRILGRPLGEAEAAQVPRLHELLEGLPLALDLAASRLREWRRPWAEYVGALSDQLHGLAALVDPEDDSRSVRAAFALSYAVLDDAQQTLFRALGALHSPTFAPAAAAALAGRELATAHPVLERLVSLSLVEAPDEVAGRYRLHALLAAYVRERLHANPAEVATVTQRHAAYFLAVAQQYTWEAYNAGLWASYDVDWPDVLAGMEWAMTGLAGDGQEAAEWVNDYASALHNVGTRRDRRLGLRWFEAGIQAARRLKDQSAEMLFLNEIGLVYDALGEKAQALEYYQQALPLRRQVGDRAGEATTLNNLGGVYSALGEKAQALEYYQQALPLFRQVGDRAGEATTLNNLGRVYDALGEKAQALEYYQQALPLRRQVGDRWGESITRFNMAMIHKHLNELDKAEEQLLQVVALDEAVGHPDLESDRAALAEVQAMRRRRI